MPETPEMEALRKTTIAGMEIAEKFKLGMAKYKLDIGNYPSTEQGLNALMDAPRGIEKKWKGPYLEEPPEDPWSQPYQYRCPGENNSLGSRGYDLWSLGPDGIESEDDITSWNK